MEGSTVEHSDSDSGESWTLLENSPTYGEEAPDVLAEHAHNPSAREHVDLHSDKDEDTDGISIISDSDPESAPCDINFVRISTEESLAEPEPAPCDLNFVRISTEDNQAEPEEMPLLASPPNNTYHKAAPIVEETDYLGDNVKYKTYVHKRNPKVGSILDIIMLGTFVITAGMALGHLWSCKNECTTQTSVNKILSNLYKLQEENAYLRSKLKEVTEATSYQLTQHLKPTGSKPNKQFRCKKIFEDPVMKNNKLDTTIKCADDNKPDVILHDSPIPEHEKEFLKDINKMKDIYDKNKDWLDKKVRRQFNELAKSKKNVQQNKLLNLEKQLGPTFIPLDKNPHKQLDPTYFEIPLKKAEDQQDNYHTDTNNPAPRKEVTLEMHELPTQNPDNVQSVPIGQVLEKKITYADSLKTDQPLQRIKRSENSQLPGRWNKEHFGKRKRKEDDIILNLNSFSEDDIKKDNRYTGPKTKYDKKKHDRQKAHKRQKRNNKYEQWEMKGGYLKDFDEFSVTSSHDNDIASNKPEKKFLNSDFENYVNMLVDAENNASNNEPKTTKNGDDEYKPDKRIAKGEKRRKAKDFEWYDQRAALRAEARIKLEQELFGENTSNTAAWYFRRMQKREQCRAQKDNSTFKKFSKHKLNFKMKR